MKKLSLLLALLLLLGAAGCRKQEEPAPLPPVEPEVPEVVLSEPLQLETLRLELSRSGADTAQALQAARELPELLETWFEETEVHVEEVTVTVGTSAAATAQALVEGRIDLAFLPAETFVLYGGASRVLLSGALQPELQPHGDSRSISDWNGTKNKKSYHDAVWESGTASLICAAPTAYGGQLAKRAESGGSLTWAELNNARWGVLDASSAGGYRCANLYLADQYEGNVLADLDHLAVYDSYEALFRAAAAEEVDILVLRKDARMDVAEAWVLESGRAAQNGMSGFGRTEPVWDEVRCLAVTETLHAVVAAAAPENAETADQRFVPALEQVLRRLGEEHPELMGMLGAPRFEPVRDSELDALRRALTIEGVVE